MRKRKKIIVIILVLAVLLGAGCWYLFLGSRITDGSSGIMAGEDGTRSLEQTDEVDEADGEQTEPEETTNINQTEDSLGSVTEGTEEYRGFVIDNVFHSVSEGDIHYNVYIRDGAAVCSLTMRKSWDGCSPIDRNIGRHFT